ncbi:alanine/glycine:cation symporter family protein [Streptomyces sp. ACA25]|uniref:alanine/glycine:cation symporter family protein n=1 Tax=Streptomyces sp. ACA25 TaxID=3022596 RepID=UPI002307C691|nr:alanine/glycine:cation symporter family protein [Streptomyces sp. ACA25]MDB1089516.1 alanine/glycine:cation symporter family protein [Streptomyces sp. ACA25]
MEEESTNWADRFSNQVNEIVEPVSTAIQEVVFFSFEVGGASIMPIVLWLVVAGVIFSAYFGLAQVRHLKTAFRIVRGKYDQKNAPGEVTHFQALTSALSGTVGLGNIAGVAIAISIGGPGAVFWMVVCGLLGMATKFAECTLGVKYREISADGTVSGGPMYYLSKGLAEVGKAGLGKILAALSPVMILVFAFFGGNVFQSNQSVTMLASETGGEDSFFASNLGALLYGLFFAVVVFLVLIGGIKYIGRVTSRLVPAMGVMYVLACLIVILWNITDVPSAISLIFSEAFNPSGVAGGVLGALIVGFQRAAFSNEAGIGSAPIAHSAVKTKRPATEGLVAMLEPFFDTVVVCTMTALTIIVAGGPMYQQARAIASGEAEGDVGGTRMGIELTADAFQTALPWFTGLLAVAVILFAFSTLITWSYYGLKSWQYLFGHSKTNELIYKTLFCGMIVVGAIMGLDQIVDMTDAFLFMAALFNIIGIYFLMPIIKQELNKVLEYVRRRDAGETDEEIDASEAAAGDGGEPGDKVDATK